MPSAEPSMQIPIPTAGIRKNLPPLEVGFSGLIDAQNWIYRDGSFVVRPGLTDFADDKNDRPMGFIQYDHGSENDRLVMGTLDAWYHYNSATGEWDEITGGTDPLTGGTTAQQVFRTFEKSGVVYLLGCNGTNNAQKWDGSALNTRAIVAGSPGSTAPVCMAVAADRLLLAEGMTVYASDNLDFDAWTDGFTAKLGDTPGDIVSMMEFGNNQTAIYKAGSVYMAFAQEDLTKIFRFELIRTGISGPVSPLSVCTLGDLGIHCYLAESGDLMLFDGTSIQSMGEHIRTHIRQTRDYDLRARSFVFFDPLQGDIYAFYAASGSDDVDTCAVVNLETSTIHSFKFSNNIISAGGAFVVSDSTSIGELPLIGDIGLTFGEMDRGQSGILLGDNGGQVYHHIGTTDDGSAIRAWFETGLQLGLEPRRFNMLHQVEHLFPTASASQTVSIQLGASDYGESRILDDAQTVNIGNGGPYETQHRLPGRMYSVRMLTDASVAVEWMGASTTMTQTGLR